MQRTFLEITHKDIKEAKSISDILQFKNRNTDQDQSAGRPTPETFSSIPKQTNLLVLDTGTLERAYNGAALFISLRPSFIGEN